MFLQRINFLAFFMATAAVHLIGFIYLYLFTEILTPVKPQDDDKKTIVVEIESPVLRKKSSTEQGEEMAKDGAKGKGFGDMFNIDKGKWGTLLDRLENSESLKNYGATFDELMPRSKNGSQFGEGYIYRKRHNEDLIVKEVFPTLKNIDKPFSQLIKASPTVLRDYKQRNEIIEQYRKWKKGDIAVDHVQAKIVKYPPKRTTTPLKFPKEARDSYFDSTLKYSKQQQLEMFLQKFMNYNPDEGDLPIATRELYYKNLQRILQAFSYDRTYMVLDYFEESLNKEDFLKHSMYQVSKLKGTKTGTELLFAIENIYEIQQNAWRYFYEFGDLYNSLPDSRKRTLRVETLRRIYERYAPLAKQKNIKNFEDALKIYTQKRIEIFNYIIKHTPSGYRLYDAKFLRAKALWNYAYVFQDIKAMNKAVEEFVELGIAVSKDSSINSTQKSKENAYNDFLHKDVLNSLLPVLKQYIEEPDHRDVIIYKIHSIMLSTDHNELQRKMEREKRILWP